MTTDYVDSRYIEVVKLSDLNSHCVVEAMEAIFARHGILELLISDNGPQYVSGEFMQSRSGYSFTHVTSSPKHSPSNGAAERAVQTVKLMLKKRV